MTATRKIQTWRHGRAFITWLLVHSQTLKLSSFHEVNNIRSKSNIFKFQFSRSVWAFPACLHRRERSLTMEVMQVELNQTYARKECVAVVAVAEPAVAVNRCERNGT